MRIKQHGLIYWGVIVLFAAFAVLLIALVGHEILKFDLGSGPAGGILEEQAEGLYLPKAEGERVTIDLEQ